jgi:hypothetical protein
MSVYEYRFSNQIKNEIFTQEFRSLKSEKSRLGLKGKGFTIYSSYNLGAGVSIILKNSPLKRSKGAKMTESTGQTLETGSIYFFYRMFIDEDSAYCSDDIHRFFMVLNPAWQRQYRIIMLGKKKQSRTCDNPNLWGIVRRTAANLEQIEIEIDAKSYHTKTRKERQLKAPRPVGHGLYRIFSQKDDTHLVYSLEFPQEISEFVPKDFTIVQDADYILKVKNPDKPFPPGFGIEDQQVQYPRLIQTLFENKPFSKAEPTEILNYEGTGLLMTPAAAKASPRKVRYETNDFVPQRFLQDLQVEKSRYRPEPLFAGSKF